MVENSEEKMAYELKFNLSSRFSSVKLFRNIEFVSSGKKKGKEKSIKGEKLYLFEKGEKKTVNGD